jgi:hypothetical protein
MKKKIGALFAELKKRSFPAMGKVVGDFGLYDSLLAGTVASFLAGLHLEDIPGPDEESEQILVLLKNKQNRNQQETEFLEYGELLERLRSELVKATRSQPSKKVG